MEQKKLTELGTATRFAGSQLFFVEGTEGPRKLTGNVLMAGINSGTFTGNISFANVQTISSPNGVVNTTDPVTALNAGLVEWLATFSSVGSGQPIKHVIMTGTNGGSYTISSNLAGNASVTFSKVGHSATFLYNNDKWFVLGGTANIVLP